eukprot:3075802-Amphidinium_carterae.1
MYPGQGSVGPGSFSYAPPVLTAGPGAGYIQFPGGSCSQGARTQRPCLSDSHYGIVCSSELCRFGCK